MCFRCTSAAICRYVYSVVLALQQHESKRSVYIYVDAAGQGSCVVYTRKKTKQGYTMDFHPLLTQLRPATADPFLVTFCGSTNWCVAHPMACSPVSMSRVASSKLPMPTKQVGADRI